MTERLYYDDPYLHEFDATVTRVDVRDGHAVIALDRTAFYPTTGGQPFDTGTLGGVPIADVVEGDDGGVEHVASAGSNGPILQAGARVHGSIDWERRFDHMQQHTGQHVLSAAFHRLFDVRTVSFHLGAEASTIDLAREMTPSEIAAAEVLANRVVWEDRPVTIRYADASAAGALPLRKESRREGRLRLIDVANFDLSACGGTHVARTGAIGVIAVASWERFKGGQRLEFLCGGRALARFRSMRDVVTGSVRLLSVMPDEVAAAIERLQAEVKEQKRAAVALQGELARYRAEEIAAAAERIESPHRVLRAVLRTVDADAGGLKALATTIAARPGYVVVLLSPARPFLVVVARSADVMMPSNQLLASLTAAFGGRGGGKSELAQGGGLDAPAQTILDAARMAIVSAHQ